MGHGLQGEVIRTSKLNLDLGSWKKNSGSHMTQRLFLFFFPRDTKITHNVISSVHQCINQGPGCWESTPFAPESMPSPILIGTAEIVRDTAQESPAKSSTICSKWARLLTHWHAVSLLSSLLSLSFISLKRTGLKMLQWSSFSYCDICIVYSF